MKTSIQLAHRFREVILNGKWIANTNWQDQLNEVDLKLAVAHVSDLNSIAKLTFHINYYIEGVLQVFEGGSLDIRDKYSFELPQMNTEQEWNALKDNLFSNSEKFANHVEQMSNEKLNEVFVDQKYGNYYRNIEGLIEHSYYHLGQITIIKKLLKNKY